MNFLRDGLSIDEMRISSLVIIFITLGAFSVYFYWTGEDISNNLTDLIKTLAFIIGGVNAVNGVATITKNIKEAKQLTQKQKGDKSL